LKGITEFVETSYMMRGVDGFLIGVLICYACGNAKRSYNDSIAGTYVREYSNEVITQLTGKKVGVRTVRDTLYITAAGKQYKVENAMWKLNDYDDDGWQNMEDNKFGPFPSFIAIYDETSRTLNSRSAPDIVVSEDGKLFVLGKSEIVYAKLY
jgi:hypothetical protein